MKSITNNILLILILASCSTGKPETALKDSTIVIPGKSADGFSLNETSSLPGDISQINNSSMPPPLSDLIKGDLIPEIKFNRIIYSRNRHIIFINNGVVTAIAGLNPANRVTDDAVKFSDGVENFIINYGNEGLKIVTEGEHKVYIYREPGIAIFDDYGDDRIDMYLIFTPER